MPVIVCEMQEEWKQDCELKAFYRLTKPAETGVFRNCRSPLLMDGLYANGPVMEVCRKNKWEFMIVLKDKTLPSVWQEAEGLMRLDSEGEYRYERKNVHERCNLAARKRWLHENNILKEKHQGYRYEHIFSHNWNAMKGYHFLMHIARMLNEMALHSISLTEHVKAVGVQSFIKNFRVAMTYRELDTKRLRRVIESPGQLRLVYEDNWKTSRLVA